MDIFTFLLKAIELLVWPAVVVFLLYLFREPLADLLDALRHATLKYKKGDTTLEAKLDTVRNKLPTTLPKRIPKRVEELAKSSPPMAVESSWYELADRARTSVAASDQVAPLNLASLLMQRGKLSENEAGAFYRLFELKDEVTRPGSTVVTDVSSATSYGRIAYALADKILPRKDKDNDT